MGAYARVLVHLGCCNKNTTNWVAYKQQTFISHGSGADESKKMALALSSEGPLSAVYSQVEGEEGLSGASFFFNFIYLFMRDSREAETQAEGEAGSLQGS